MATEDALVKRFFGHLGTYQMTLFPVLYSLPFFLMAIPFAPWPDEITPGLVWSFIFIMVTWVPTYIMFIKAIRISPMSLTIPFLSFVPVFAALTGYVLLDEAPSAWGGAGIALVVIGSYLLNLDKARNGDIWGPFRAMVHEPGSRLMFILAVVWGVAATVGRMAVIESSAMFFGVYLYVFFNPVVALAAVALGGRRTTAPLFRMPVKGLIVGLLFFGHAILHHVAISMVQAAYMLSVKRLNVVVAVFYGWLLFKEKHIGQRLFAVLIMFLGVVLIAWLG